MRSFVRLLLALAFVSLALLLLHAPFLRLPYFWDEAGYYVPAALDFYRHGWWIPRSTLPTGHTPLVMVYLGMVWRLAGASILAARAAMLLVAAATVVTTFRLARVMANREVAAWSAACLALSPLFFAQSSLVLLDLPAALFTTLAMLTLLKDRGGWFAVSASLAVLTKETAAVLLPVAWAFACFRRHERRLGGWAAMVVPLVPLAVWAAYYHHQTGYWTGNASYLQYNLYSAMTPLHILRSFVARLDEVFLGGFNFVFVAGALGAGWWRQKRRQPLGPMNVLLLFRDFAFLAAGLIGAYVLMLSLVGGAALARYLLPIFPLFFVGVVALIFEFPKPRARAICAVGATCLAWGWFLNPPYPFPYENNLAYADFVRLHQRAARDLESMPGQPRILTAWPATDELSEPSLGYVGRALRVDSIPGFAACDFDAVPPFDLLYIYSRKWEPPGNLLSRFGTESAFVRRFYNYSPQVPEAVLIRRYRLILLKDYRRGGQWARIYRRQSVDRGR